MGLGENSPLRGSQERIQPYVFMTDPNRAYKKKVRQLQCYLCSAILAVFLLALVVSVTYSVDHDEEDLLPSENGSLSLNLKSPVPQQSVEEIPSGDAGNHLSYKVHPEPEYPPSPKKEELPQPIPDIGPCKSDENINFECLSQMYRSPTGACNNLNHPLTWGVTGRPLKRLLQPDYCDGKASPQCASSKSPLPSSLKVGWKLYQLEKDKIRDNNIVLGLWGLFVHQDLVGSSNDYEKEEKSATCCSGVKDDSSCFNMELSMEDPFYSVYNSTCLPFIRSNAAMCDDGIRRQLNKATSFLDGSSIYGSSIGIQHKLRKFQDGQLALYRTPENKFLPTLVNQTNECLIASRSGERLCLNQEPSCLSKNMNFPSINLMFARHHNFIASQLKMINPQWDDEQLFQNTRRIVTAQIQHITYNEFLENIVGPDMMKIYGDNSETGYFEEYNGSVDASTSSAFDAAIKLVYLLIPENGNYQVKNKETETCNFHRLGHHVQRGRDQGIPGYTKWREFCHLGKVGDFANLSGTFGVETVAALQQLYQNVHDVDLIVGLLAELPATGNILGPVGSCIVNEQFKRTKTGDRFWYESSQKPQLFSRAQLEDIHKSTLSKIICDNSQNLDKIQYNIMKETGHNPVMSCYTIPSLNLTLWQEKAADEGIKMKKAGSDEMKAEEFMKSGNKYILQAAKKTNVTKKAASFTVNIVNATLKINDDMVWEAYTGRPPFSIPLDNFADLSAYNPSVNIQLTASYEDDIVEGTITLPYKNPDTFQKGKNTLTLSYIAGVTLKWGGTFTHDPKQTFNCKLMFQSYTKLSPSDLPTVKESPAGTPVLNLGESGESCNVMAIGTYYSRPYYCALTPWWCEEGTIFYWSGEAKLIFTKPNNMVQNTLKTMSKVETSDKSKHIVGKTGDDVVEKTFASVTVIRGKVTGQFNGEEAMTLLDGSPPVDIPLDNFINPNSFDGDTSVMATWSGTPSDDRVIVGEFSIPYFPTPESGNLDRRKFTGNFSIDVIYKYGGSIDIIVPSKTYTCKVMFQAKKKLNLKSTNENDYPVTIKEKTAFGESCSITFSGSFYEKSIFCALTPWWCSDEKIFQWSGDMELALKYKYNASDPSTMKKVAVNELPTKSLDSQDWFHSHGHRFGGRVLSGWVQTKTGGLFSSSQTVWSGETPFEIPLPIFWTPSDSGELNIPEAYGHSILWSASIFHSTVQGSFSFPQYVGYGPSMQWINGKFSVQLELNPWVSLYDMIVPGMQYKSNMYFHNTFTGNFTPFFNDNNNKVGDPTEADIRNGIRAPIILLGRHTSSKSFIWNGTFVVAFTRSAKDIYYGWF